VLGDSVSDRAVVGGNAVGGPPTGTVSFSVCGPLAAGTCQTGGTALGTNGVSAIAGTNDSEAVSESFMPTQAGRYCFRGDYSGDADYGASSDSSEAECFAVTPAPSATVTAPSSGSFDLGGSVTDGVVVTGNTAGGDPMGTVSFFVCGPMPTGTCDTGGTPLGSATLGPDANAATFTATATSAAYTPGSPGRYCFRGVYSGDANYQPSSDSGANECFSVTALPPLPPPPATPPAVCGTLRIDKKTVSARVRTTVRATVRNTAAEAMAGVRVIARGAGVRTSARTNTLGVARLVLRPRSAGVVRLRALGSTRCVARLVARGVFRPPALTGRR
jgi:hypothetical protein